jgi:hypothetical protein
MKVSIEHSRDVDVFELCNTIRQMADVEIAFE